MSPNAQNGPRDKVTFAANLPTFVGLEFDPPTEPREGRFGDQFLYFLADHKIMFVDPPVHAAIIASGATAGSEIAITKRETRDGNRRAIAWDVQRVEEEPVPPVPAPAAPQTTATQQTRTHATQPAPAPASVPQPPAAAPTPATGPAQPATADQLDMLALTAALNTAIDAAAIAETHARTRGLAIRFAAEDVRTMANALMMRQERQGRA
jgi:hypothetical protein